MHTAPEHTRSGNSSRLNIPINKSCGSCDQSHDGAGSSGGRSPTVGSNDPSEIMWLLSRCGGRSESENASEDGSVEAESPNEEREREEVGTSVGSIVAGDGGRRWLLV